MNYNANGVKQKSSYKFALLVLFGGTRGLEWELQSLAFYQSSADLALVVCLFFNTHSWGF